MLRYLIRRMIVMIPTVIGVTLITFTLTRIVPADPVRAVAGIGASEQTIEAMRRELGLDKPILVQYGFYMRDIIQGNLGKSIKSGQPVAQEIARFFPATVELALFSFCLLCIIGVPLGIFTATHRGGGVEVVSRVTAIAATAMPVFWLALILQYVFYYRLAWLPLISRLDDYGMRPNHVTGLYVLDSLLGGDLDALGDALKHMILPVVTLVAGRLAIVVRMTRICIIEVLSQGYVRTANAKGLTSFRVIYVHVLKNAAVPILTELGMQFAWLLGGSVYVVEAIFAWPGTGLYALRSLIMLDFNSIMAVTLLMTGIFLATNLAVDVIYSLVDPRIRLE